MGEDYFNTADEVKLFIDGREVRMVGKINLTAEMKMDSQTRGTMVGDRTFTGSLELSINEYNKNLLEIVRQVKQVEKYLKIMKRTKSKRIKKKQLNKLIKIIDGNKLLRSIYGPGGLKQHDSIINHRINRRK